MSSEDSSGIDSIIDGAIAIGGLITFGIAILTGLAALTAPVGLAAMLIKFGIGRMPVLPGIISALVGVALFFAAIAGFLRFVKWARKLTRRTNRS